MSRIFPRPWLKLEHSKDTSKLIENREAFKCLRYPRKLQPSFTLLVGRKVKTNALRYLVRNDPVNFPDGHGEVYIWDDPFLEAHGYIDFELHVCRRQSSTNDVGDTTVRSTEWLGTEETFTRRKLANLLSGRAIAPMCVTLCYFADDVGGLRGVASLLAAQIGEEPASDLPLDCSPQVLVVFDTTPLKFDADSARRTLFQSVAEMMPGGQQRTNCQARLAHSFASVEVIGLAETSSPEARSAVLRAQLQSLQSRGVAARMSHGLIFNRDHTFTFFSKLLDHFFASYKTKFSFLHSSRPVGFSLSDLKHHLHEVINILPSEAWVWHLLCPLFSSTIIFANYPPGSHRFPASALFDTLYRARCEVIFAEAFVQPDTRVALLKGLEKQTRMLFQDGVVTNCSTATYHANQLVELWPYLHNLQSHRSCLACLLRTPEKVLSCGHALCDVCVRTFGTQSIAEKYSFVIKHCPLCGTPNSQRPFGLLPPTAGIRLLALDGGGVRGIIPLVFLHHIQLRLERLHVALPEIFDFVCGTSAGGLVIIGLFLMQWNTAESMRKFEHLAIRTFNPSNSNLSFSRIQQLALSYLRDCRYSSAEIEKAFQSAFGKQIKMFNPLASDTKVAVTTTTAKDTRPCLFSNYNGGIRPDNLGYELVRAEDAEHDVDVSQAASSTSAAPWYFKPKVIPNVGTFQDGGLHHNNPLSIALWETSFLWPDRPLPDFALSIGTGSCAAIGKPPLSTQSPVKDRFITRLFKTFMRSLDGERIWRDFYNGLPELERHRFHRMNLELKGSEPAIDDLDGMLSLKRDAEDFVEDPRHLTPVLDAILASSFYFEFEDVPVKKDDVYHCTGHIYCRLRLSTTGRRVLYEELIRTRAYFLVLGKPVKCVERIPRGAPLFKRRVQFELGSLQEIVGVTLRGLTSNPVSISGLPKAATSLIQMQRLEAPFGRADHLRGESALPGVPSKRKRGTCIQS